MLPLAGCGLVRDCDPSDEVTRCSDNKVWVCTDSGSGRNGIGWWSLVIDCGEFAAECTAGDFEKYYTEYCADDGGCAEFDFQTNKVNPEHEDVARKFELEHMCVKKDLACDGDTAEKCSEDLTFAHQCLDVGGPKAVITQANTMMQRPHCVETDEGTASFSVLPDTCENGASQCYDESSLLLCRNSAWEVLIFCSDELGYPLKCEEKTGPGGVKIAECP